MEPCDGNKIPYGDPLSRPFWAAASRHQLVVQKCGGCGRHQFYPRPFCMVCASDDVVWTPVSGAATVYSVTTVHLQIAPEFEPPYQVAVVELDVGPRLLTRIEGGNVAIGDPVQVTWEKRDGLPPLPVFRRVPVDKRQAFAVSQT